MVSFAWFALLSSQTLMHAQTRPAASEPTSVVASNTPAIASGAYVGEEACRSCHKAEFREFHKTVHARIPAKEGHVAGCEVCHGPGKAHSDAEEAAHGDDAATAAANKLVFSFRGSPRENWERCQQCHTSSHEQSEFERSTHARHGVGCNECHATHLVEAARDPNRHTLDGAQATFFSVPNLGAEVRWLNSSLLKESQPKLCNECHANVVAQFALPNHHPVPEGAMKCTDCHSPHGADGNRSMLREAGYESCVRCHVEKRGPFVFEHASVRVMGCTSCHTPHGTINKFLMVKREQRFLCLSCHVAPQAANTPHSRLSFQTSGDCTRCHVSIHGSNFDVDYTH
jgi:predicted CXXCH cytochrome family protein